MSRIFDTVYSGNLEELKRIVVQNPESVHIKSTNGWYIWGWTPLDIAINHGKLEIAKFLYEKGGRPNFESYSDGIDTPVHHAAEYGYTATLKWVFTESVLSFEVLKIKDFWKRNPLDIAIALGNLEMVQFLWGKGGRPNLDKIYGNGKGTLVHRAAQDGHASTLKWVFEKGISRNVLNTKDSDGWTPLDCAIKRGELEMVQFLWEKGGRPNSEIYCDGKNTPVHIAAYYGYAILKWVFTEDVLSLDVLKIKNKWKLTPLDEAISWDKLEMAQYLWDKGGRPNFEIYYCDGKRSPVHKAASCGYTKTLKWLFTENVLSLDALKIKDERRKTPLDCAIDYRELETAALIRRLMYFNPVFLAMQRAKRNHHRTLLRRLPDELLDMVVDKVAARFDLKVVW